MKTNRQTRCTVLSLLILYLVFLPLYSAMSEDVSYSYDVLENGSLLITACITEDTVIILPGELDGKTVSAIGEHAFSMCNNLFAVILPRLDYIESGAFLEASNLRTVAFTDEAGDLPEDLFDNDAQITFLFRAGTQSASRYLPDHDVCCSAFNELCIGNAKTKKYHILSCSSIDDMSRKNKVLLTDCDLALENAFVPCKRCHPSGSVSE